jgi:hypothetical protein
LGSFIDPETSSKKTRFAAGRWPRSISRPLIPIRASR